MEVTTPIPTPSWRAGGNHGFGQQRGPVGAQSGAEWRQPGAGLWRLPWQQDLSDLPF